jgi:hypothetical protein
MTFPDQTCLYGGIASCKLDRKQLELRFDAKLTAEAEIDGFTFDLQVDDAPFERLKGGLQRIFPADDRPKEFQV